MNTSLQLLKSHFGFNEFRQGQQQVVDTILSGSSSAAIFPTGSGKSLCYQLPAIALPNLTLVVSPLLALMQDQLQFLKNKGIAAASIDSSQTREQGQQVMQDVRDGRIKILMISVERLNNERFRQFLQGIEISLLVVDEAHCISEWGHNFRPDYLKLPSYQKQFNIQQTLLLTATATEQVIEDMGRKFAIAKENIVTTGFYRANLNLAVTGIRSEDKVNFLSEWLQPKQGLSGIVYVTLQKTAEQVAQQLLEQGLNVSAYHAGMDSDLRTSIQQRFMNGQINIIVATIAFGMGVDKSDIRFVVHYDLPKSIENYAQEIGRAGRDGGAADCLVLANGDNLNVLENFVYGDTPEPQAIAYVLNEVINQASTNQGQFEVMLNALSRDSNIRILTLKTLLVYLELVGLVKPAYSYYADYKFKLQRSEAELIDTFSGERQQFVRALLNSSDKAKIWYSINFDRLNEQYPSERSRVIAAIEYFEQQGYIELQTKQMTEVFKVNRGQHDQPQLSDRIYRRFIEKERSEIDRIHRLLNFFTSDQCLTKQMAEYFADYQLQQSCGHCSVCQGVVARLPAAPVLVELTNFNFDEVCLPINEKLGEHSSAVMIARFLCGLTTPLFTRLKVRQVPGFARFEHYRYSDVLAWVNSHR